MNYTLRMKILETLQNLFDIDNDQRLGEIAVVSKLGIKRAIFYVFENDIKMLIGLQRIHVFDDLRVLQPLEQLYFGLDRVLAILFDVVDQNLLDGDCLPSRSI